VHHELDPSLARGAAAAFGISMPMISSAGDTMRALMPAMSPCWVHAPVSSM